MAALALGLSTLGNFYSGSVAKRHASRARRHQEAAYRRQLGLANLYGDQSFAQLQSGLNTLGEGFTQARAEAGSLGKAARQRVADNAVVAKGQAQQNLLNTGFDRSNISSQVDRSLAADALRRNQEIDQGLAQLYSQLAVNKARAEADMRRAMAAQIENRSSRLLDIEKGYGDTMLGLDQTTFQGPQYDFAPFVEVFKGMFADKKKQTPNVQGFSGFDFSSGDYSY